jgi:TRAP-type C4-dicarboxylate transport system substrate-binding protein
MMVSQHSYQPGIIVYSKSWFDGLPSDIQRVLLEVPAADVTAGRNGVRRMDPILLQNLTKAGLTVHRPTAAELAPFHQVARPVPDRIAAKSGRGGRNLLKAIRAAGR